MKWGTAMTGGQYRYAALRAAREAKGMRVPMLAAHLGVSRQAIWRLENGHQPSLTLIRRAAQFLGLDWREVITPQTLNNAGEWLEARTR
jgi:transcriptional regulator with XRE-family HTH domain